MRIDSIGVTRPVTIAIDADDVVLDLVGAWLLWYNKEYEDSMEIGQIHSWEIHEYVKPECGMKIYDFLKLENCYDNVKVIPHALQSILMLRLYKYDTVFLTAKYHPQKMEILRNLGLIRSDEDFIVSKNKNRVKADVLIDDSYDNVFRFSGTGMLLSKPWNIRNPWALRFNNWYEIVDYLTL